ncbi:unnamed protein product, partial [Ixodes pacificus]
QAIPSWTASLASSGVPIARGGSGTRATSSGTSRPPTLGKPSAHSRSSANSAASSLTRGRASWSTCPPTPAIPPTSAGTARRRSSATFSSWFTGRSVIQSSVRHTRGPAQKVRQQTGRQQLSRKSRTAANGVPRRLISHRC